MEYKLGDVVIKNGGGNKMIIESINGCKASCFWFVGKELNKNIFNNSEIILYEDYKKREIRNLKIGEILS